MINHPLLNYHYLIIPLTICLTCLWDLVDENPQLGGVGFEGKRDGWTRAEMEEDKRASRCYVLLDRPEGESLRQFQQSRVTPRLSFGEPREAPLALSRMNFSRTGGVQKGTILRAILCHDVSLFRERPSVSRCETKNVRKLRSLLYYVRCFSGLSTNVYPWKYSSTNIM